MPQFTPNQQLAIDTRDCNILVSAAAGSGKTSVLVERIIGRVMSVEDPVDIDRLLVMTFTNAAAAQLRERIREGLEGSEKQRLLVNNAMITTIHGFCKSVITDHFEKIGLDPNFRVADENECRLMRQDALDTYLEEAYRTADPSFLRAVECFSAGKNDSGIADLVIPVYEFIMADPDPEGFLRKCCESYDCSSYEEFENSTLVQQFKAYREKELARIKRAVEDALRLIDDNEGLEPYRATIEAYGLDPFSPDIPALGRVMDKNLDDHAKEAKGIVKSIRDDIKGRVSRLQEYPLSEMRTVYEHMSETGEELSALADLVLGFAKEYESQKRNKNVIDFNDMEHLAVKVLKDPAVADVYRDYFEEIYIDEYQDSNMTQEMLVTLICRKDPGNVFQVGDVKQSIYRFRQARPDIFLEKYNTYTDEPGYNRRILLNDNFRSRREVTDAVNEVFSAIMKKDLGGIEYDADAALSCASTCYTEDIPCDGDTYRAEIVTGIRKDLTGDEIEADIIADRIRSMIDAGYKIYDKEAKIIRPASYRDFTILVRSIKNPEPVFRKVFASCSIPLSVTGREGYFETTEVRTVLAFLSAVDNSLCDIPLAAVARSPVGGFSDKELAVLTAAFGADMCLYDRMRAAAEKPGDDSVSDGLKDRCAALLDLLDRYKVMSTYADVHSIITHFVDNEYGDCVRCMNNAAQRMANIKMLLVKAEEYGRTSFKGLYQFVRYMDQIKKYSIDDGEASVAGENDDVVKIMTIHASKGLEFPVVFVAGIGKQRNTKDESGKLLQSTSLGFGCDHTDLERRTVSPTLAKFMVSIKNREDGIAEEMRILYVAMTRAREKLILVGSTREKAGDSPERVQSAIEDSSSYLDMLKFAHKSSGFKHFDISEVTEADLVAARFEDVMEEESAADEMLGIVREAGKDAGAERQDIPACLQNAGFTYPFTIDPDRRAKLSVSELKHRAIEEEIARGAQLVPEGQTLFGETQPETYIPAFMRKEGETATGGTFYGTAFHRIMELWDYTMDKHTVTAQDVTEFTDSMRSAHRMDKEQADAIRPDDVAFFLNSELAKRMGNAGSAGKLFREQPFVIGIPDGGETVLVQGIIDAYFIEDDGITVVDYKTDHVNSEEMLVKRYRAQLEYYGMALSQILQVPVKALIIYSTHLRSAICVSHQAAP